LSELLNLKICKLYYQKGLTKQDIGKRLKVSRFKVAKILDDAVQDGTVTITIKEPPNGRLGIENALEDRFDIFRAVVTEASESYEETRANIGRAAANCLLDMVEDGDTIGIAWGTTIYEMVKALPRSSCKRNIKVVQITGGYGDASIAYESPAIAHRMAEVFNAKCYQLFAPAIFDKEETKNLMLKESNIAKTIEMFSQINIAIIGLGSVLPELSNLHYKHGYITKDDFNEIIKGNAVGNVNSYFYDLNGRKCASPIDQRTLDMNIDQLKRIRYVMALAGGNFKIQAIYAALKGKISNIIITDERTAQEVLAM
jgi:deoxyribonucleoside regulator